MPERGNHLRFVVLKHSEGIAVETSHQPLLFIGYGRMQRDLGNLCPENEGRFPFVHRTCFFHPFCKRHGRGRSQGGAWVGRQSLPKAVFRPQGTREQAKQKEADGKRHPANPHRSFELCRGSPANCTEEFSLGTRKLPSNYPSLEESRQLTVLTVLTFRP